MGIDESKPRQHPLREAEGASLSHLEAEAPEQNFESVAYGLEILHGSRRVGGEVESAEELANLRYCGVVDRG